MPILNYIVEDLTMYLPIFRGRKFELLALEFLIQNDLLGDKIIPIIEPVKMTSTLRRVMESFVEKRHEIGIICNPIVGEMVNESAQIISTITEINEFQEYLIPVLYMNEDCDTTCRQLLNYYSKSDLIAICTQMEQISKCLRFVQDENLKYILVGESRDFTRQIPSNIGERVLCADRFSKRQRNVDYIESEDEFFSSDHIYFREDGFKGISDYSIIGEEFIDGGFAPKAVAIHIIYQDTQQEFRIHHFVSDSNDDTNNPAGKFGEAVRKLWEWANRNSWAERTRSMQEFCQLYSEGRYPGLGIIKKLSIQHHLELVNQYFATNNHE